MTGDQARVSVSVAVAPATAFGIFTDDIDRWWLRGIKFRHAGAHSGLLRLEPEIGGRLFESFDADGTEHVIVVGRITVWEPPRRVHFTWRNTNFAPHEHTQVEVEFSPQHSGTLVTVTHRGLSMLPPDHPARHGLLGADFNRMIGLWWGEQMTAFRRDCAAK